MTISILKELKTQLRRLPYDVVDKRMLWAACCMAFYGFLRSSEFTCQTTDTFNPDQSLLRRDICRQDPVVTVEIKASKTDPFRHGMSVTLAETGTSTCPVRAITMFLTVTPNRAVHLPLFQFVSGKFLTRQSPTRIMRDLLSSDVTFIQDWGCNDGSSSWNSRLANPSPRALV